MPQGKLKVKAKIPVGAKVKQRTIKKAKDLQKRNRPALPKKGGNVVGAAITRAINEANETTVREKAVIEGKVLHVLPSKEFFPAAEASKAGTAANSSRAAQKGKGKKGKGNKGK